MDHHGQENISNVQKRHMDEELSLAKLSFGLLIRGNLHSFSENCLE